MNFNAKLIPIKEIQNLGVECNLWAFSLLSCLTRNRIEACSSKGTCSDLAKNYLQLLILNPEMKAQCKIS